MRRISDEQHTATVRGVMRRSLTTIVLCLAVIAGPVAIQPVRAAAASSSLCAASRGTIIAVDFAPWGGPIVRGCGIDQHSGYALLHAAGFTTAGDAHDGPAFICRLGAGAFNGGTQYPTPSQSPCILTPSASAYWSYWQASAGQNNWTYSPLGPNSDVPKPGEVELWVFGGTNLGGTSGSGVPTFTPNSLRPYANPKATIAKATIGTTPTTIPVVAARPARQQPSAGSVAPLVIGICLAGVLCGGAGWAAWRRRRYE